MASPPPLARRRPRGPARQGFRHRHRDPEGAGEGLPAVRGEHVVDDEDVVAPPQAVPAGAPAPATRAAEA